MRRRRGFPKAVLALVVVVTVGVLGYLLFSSGAGPFPDPENCVATADGQTVVVDLEQAGNAAVIAGIAVGRGLPARAVSIALATAYQESDIRNIDYGDRDSLGLFQQRPSQGWGTEEQIQDPHHASEQFYDALQQVDGYRQMEITEAAQAVQRSAYADAYADHERDARILASAFTGYSPQGISCVVRHDDAATQDTNEQGLTPRAQAVLDDIERSFGEQSVGGFAPGGVTDGHIEGSAHYEGRALDIFFRPVDDERRRAGWAMAHYLVSRAKELQIQTVIYDDRIWTAGLRSEAGWRDYREPEGENVEVLQHRDHVHVDVIEGSTADD
jgi:hypothetical protein